MAALLRGPARAMRVAASAAGGGGRGEWLTGFGLVRRMTSSIQDVFTHIENNQQLFVKRLAEWVSVRSVSSQPELRGEVLRMVQMTAQHIERLGGAVEMVDIGTETLADGSKLALPPVILAEIGRDPAKKTVCVYGHLDVQPAQLEDGWDSDPFTLTHRNGKMYGRGATDDKGPVLSWLNCIESFQAVSKALPVNVKLCLEGMEESGSIGLGELIAERGKSFFGNVDCVCISDSYWLGTQTPCLTFGLRGLCYFEIEVQCAQKDLHSGVYGGSVHEAMTDLTRILASLVDSSGRILVPGIYESVKPLSEMEAQLCANVDFSPEEYRLEIGATTLQQHTKEDILNHRWHLPSLSIHGIEGAFSELGQKTVIPSRVVGKFSIRTVPDMEPDEVERQVKDYVAQTFSELRSPNRFRITMPVGSQAWVADSTHPNYTAGRNAMRRVFGVEPNLIRDGCSIPVTLDFARHTALNVLLLSLGACDDGAHSQNEKFNLSNYMNGMKVMASYLEELSLVLPKE
ncbi:unnamed protein product [Lampetra planeri]